MSTRQEKILERYKSQLDWYERTRDRARISFYTCQILSVVCSALTTVIIATTDSKAWQASFSAVAAISTGILAIAQFQDSWRRRALAAERLKSEFALFAARIGRNYGDEISEDAAEVTFGLRVEEIIGGEIAEWDKVRQTKTENS